MYPKLSDMLMDIFGWSPPLPIQTFGFFMALAFIVAAFIAAADYKRLEREGWLVGIPEKRTVGQAASPFELLFNAITGFIMGWKGSAMVLNWSDFSNNPQGFLLSTEGNVIGGIVGAIAIAYWAYHDKEKQRLDKPQEIEVIVHPHERVGDFIIMAAIWGVIGAKAFMWLEDIDGFMSDPWGAIFSFAGMNYYGGLVVASIALLWLSHKKKMSMLRTADVCAPVLILGYGIGRMGCHFSGDGDWGVINTAPKPITWLPDWLWSYNYPNNVIRECSSQMMNGDIVNGDCVWSQTPYLITPVYPTSVYETIMATCIFLFLWFVLRKRLTPLPGLLFSVYFFFNGLERFLIETIRVNPRYDVLGFQLSQAQIIACVLMLIGIGLGIYLLNKHKKNPPKKMTSPSKMNRLNNDLPTT